MKTVFSRYQLTIQWILTTIRWFLISFFVVSILIPIFFFIAAFISKLTIIECFLAFMPQEHFQGENVLVFGVDDTKYVKRADSVLLFHMQADKNRIGIVSIPRDTRLYVPEKGLTKMNHAYAYGGTQLLLKTISEFSSLPIKYYIKVNLDGVKDMVDQLGGLSVEVEKDLYYVDQAGDLNINLKQGSQVLSGEKAVQYLRFRQDKDGDIGRIRRQQTFIAAVVKKIVESNMYLELPSLIKRLKICFRTNLSTKQMIGFALQFVKAYQSSNIEKTTVPGAVALINGVSYWRPDMQGVSHVVEHTLLGFESDTAKSDDSSDAVSEVAAESNSGAIRRTVTLKEVKNIVKQLDATNSIVEEVGRPLIMEVLNGSGKAGSARQAAHFFKGLGLKVPIYGNAGSFDYENTLIVDWKGTLDKTVAFAVALSIDPSKIIVYDRPHKPLDVTIVLGKDWGQIQKKIKASQQ